MREMLSELVSSTFLPCFKADGCNLNSLLELSHPLQPVIMLQADSISSTTLLEFHKYESLVELLRRQHVRERDSTLSRLSFLQQIPKVTATPDRESERDFLWSCVLGFIQGKVRPLLERVAQLKEALGRVINKGLVDPLSSMLKYSSLHHPGSFR